MMALRRIAYILAAVLFFALASRASTDPYGALEKEALGGLWEHRGDPGGIVALYRADALQENLDSAQPYEEVLKRVIGAPDSDPEVRAHAIGRLERLYRDHGKIEEAKRLNALQGFILAWRVIGPFDDENKVGFEAEYPPEKEWKVEGSYEGKGHSVAWREMPEPAPWGVVPLDQLLDPAERVVGYAMTFVRVERDTPCVLRGGYNEAYKMWVDGEYVAGRKVYNGRALDQYADACTLRRGWNVILVKLCNQDDAWNFTLRITDGVGGGLKGWRATADPSQVEETMAKMIAKDGTPPPSFKFEDPEGRLAEKAEKTPTAENLFLYGMCLTDQRTYDRTDDKNVQTLRKAAQAEGSTPAMWVALGDAEEDHNKKRAAYQRALDEDASNVEALERMARYELQRGLPFAALPYVERAAKAHPESPSIQAMEGALRLQYITDGLAASELTALHRRHPECPDVMESYMEGLKAMGQAAELSAALEAYRQVNQSEPGAWYNEIADLIGSGRSQETIHLFEEMEKRFPMDRTVVFRHASYLLSLNHAKEALEIVAPAMRWAPDWPEGLELNGDALEALGRTDEALAQYQEALILRPQMESVKRKVTFLKPQQEGFEAQYRIAAKDLPADVGPYVDQQGVVILDNTAVKVQPNGLSSRYVQRVIQVLQAGAAHQMQYWPIPFDPDRQEVRILEASILKADGSKIHADTMVTDALSDPQYRLYYRNRNLVLSFPSLTAGDRLWIEYKISDVGESNDYGQYFGDLVPFGSSMPILMKQYTLILPASFPLSIEVKDVSVQPIILTLKGEKSYRWVVRNIDRMQQEPGMPGYTEVGPYLHVSTFQNWDAMGAWYAKFIADQWESSPEVKAKVAELTKGCATPEDKARAIHRWVVQQTHYVGLEFGVHGFKPYKVRQIFERRFGDCKDKAILMAAMMREAGLDACMVLVRTRDNGDIAPNPASLAIFNHCICYLPQLDLFLDGTAEYSSLHELPFQDQGIWVLLVWPDGRTKRVETPADKPESNSYSADYVLRVPSSGTDVEAAGEVQIRGQECSWIRRRYQDPDKVQEQLQKDLSNSFPGTQLKQAETSPMGDLLSGVTISYKGMLGQAARPDGKGRVSLPIWIGHLSLSNTYATLTDRTFPLEIDYPWTQSYRVAYELPPGANAPSPSPVDIKTPYGSVARSSSRDGSRLTVTTTVVLAVRRVMPDQYDAFREFCKEADQVVDERLRIELGGGQP